MHFIPFTPTARFLDNDSEACCNPSPFSRPCSKEILVNEIAKVVISSISGALMALVTYGMIFYTMKEVHESEGIPFTTEPCFPQVGAIGAITGVAFLAIHNVYQYCCKPIGSR